MVFCNHCLASGRGKYKLRYNAQDHFHPFRCPNCGHEDWYIDERTGTIKEW